MALLLTGEIPEPLVAAFLTLVRARGETADILSGACEAVRARMVPFEPPVRPILDTCGTGGDGVRSVNISTAAALVVAACGVAVAKHGNRSATGNSGSSEVLEALGIPVEVPADHVAASLSALGIGFLFAPRYHPALRSVASVRRALPFRTLFNLLGPLVNPARPEYQLVGVSSLPSARLMADTLALGPTLRAAVVSSDDGLDEVSLGSPTRVFWVESGHVSERVWHPSDFGLGPVSPSSLAVSGPTESASLIRSFLSGSPGPVRDVVLANAAAALLVANKVSDLPEGVSLGSEAIDSGRVMTLLEHWAARLPV
jgi:anthranilate phosphoribosyltransferase